jgi:prepilin-type N-terminal cleavage/methylation domain-containing protein
MSAHRPRSAGFTMIEILVAIVLFFIGALALTRMQVSTIRAATFGREAMVTTNLAQNAVEVLKSRNKTSFATLLANNATVVTINTTSPGVKFADIPGLASANIPGLAMTWTASNIQGTAPDRNLTVTVTVTWRGQSLSFATIRSET